MIRIVVCGNTDRGDDGAGPAVARLLLERGIEASIHTGDPLALLDRWRPTDDVILVDAVVTGAPLGAIRVWDSLPAHIPASTTASSHGFDIAKAIELARALGRIPAKLRIYGIEGRQFDAGSPISPEVEDAIKTVGSRIAAEIQADIQEPELLAYSGPQGDLADLGHSPSVRFTSGSTAESIHASSSPPGTPSNNHQRSTCSTVLPG